jgi:hypothetical protein
VWGAASGLVLVGAYVLSDIASALRLDIAIVFLVFIYLLAYFGAFRRTGRTEWLHLRSVIPSVVLISLLLYPILERGLEIDRRQQMEQAALSFEEEMDSRVMFAIRQVLARAQETDLPFDVAESPSARGARYDSLAGALTIGELISALGTHDISVTVYSSDGTPL